MDTEIGTREQESGKWSRPPVEYAADYCPVCSLRLEARQCKKLCTGCGYYMSCSDFY